MVRKGPFSSRWHCFLLGTLFICISISVAKGSNILLTKSELKAKYGQENATFNDGRSCCRPCDGQIMTCYYDTLSGLCGACENGTIQDCFNPGCIPANGMERSIMKVNQKLPGPIISVCKNDRIIVDISNHMAGQELTMHWHGIHQKESPWFDGVPMVTQCPIYSGNTFRYTFNASEVGTHIYHAHSGVHRLNGLFGKLIVREQNDLDEEFSSKHIWKFRNIILQSLDFNRFCIDFIFSVINLKAVHLLPQKFLLYLIFHWILC